MKANAEGSRHVQVGGSDHVKGVSTRKMLCQQGGQNPTLAHFCLEDAPMREAQSGQTVWPGQGTS